MISPLRSETVAILEVDGILFVCVWRSVYVLCQMAGVERCGDSIENSRQRRVPRDDLSSGSSREDGTKKMKAQIQQNSSYGVKICWLSPAFLAKQYIIYVYPVNFKYYNWTLANTQRS